MNEMASLQTVPALSTVFSGEQIRAHEQMIFATGVAPYTLMDQAGAAILIALQRRWPEARRVAVVVGKGQNAGDGLVVARRALEAGLTVDLYGWAPAESWAGAALQAWQELMRHAPDCRIHNEPTRLLDAEVVVDALFGIGLNRPIEGVAASWVAAINAAHRSGVGVIAVDLPSGLLADTGQVLESPQGSDASAVQADVTVSFLALKPGLFTGHGSALAGRVMVSLLGQPLPDVAPVAQLLLHPEPLPVKPKDGHKGTFGTVLVIGGNCGMGGAARMVAEAALRVGAGKVILAVHPSQVTGLNGGRPELMVYGVDAVHALMPLLALADAVVLGPGLGQDDWARSLAESALAFVGPMIVDADGLRFLSSSPRRDHPTVLTPHPAEAGRLLDCSTADIQADRLSSATRLRDRYRAAALLKGAGSILAVNAGLLICVRGDPALATAGSGDVLSGVIGGLLAMGHSPDEALRRGVCWHAVAGEIEAQARGSWGLAATDLLLPIRALANGRMRGSDAELPCLLP